MVKHSVIPQAFFAVFTISMAFLFSSLATLTEETFGNWDFLQYWSSFQIATAGGNPYDATTLYNYEVRIRPTLPEPLMMWNPPWILLLMSPILVFGFEISQILFRACNVIMYVVAVLLLCRSFNVKRAYLERAICLSLTFFPFWETLACEQVSIILLLGSSIFIQASQSRFPNLLKTVGLLLCTIKPHILYLFFAAVLFNSIREKNVRFMVMISGGLVALLSVTEVVFPGLIWAWLSAAITPEQRATPVFTWRPVSLVTPLSDIAIPLLNQRFGIRSIVLGVSVSLMLLCLLILAAFTFRRDGAAASAGLSMERVSLAVCCSCLTFPHGWLSDHVVLLLPILYLFAKSGDYLLRANRSRFLLITVWVIVSQQILTFSLTASSQRELSSFYWFPIPVLLLFWLNQRMRGSTIS